VTARPATPEDADSIARIYNEGMEDRVATFETRRRSAGRIALQALIVAAKEAGFWKLLSRIFLENIASRPENIASRGLVRQLGFREVGVYEKHGQLDGESRDVVIVERLIG
jgi:L-amino acid N-acyltransferase YncA